MSYYDDLEKTYGSRVIRQGKVIIEQESEGTFLIMTPDGQITGAASRGQAERISKKWLRDNLPPDAVGVATIEWR